jgi:ribosomal-protein-alanine N-acetyltransferase
VNRYFNLDPATSRPRPLPISIRWLIRRDMPTVLAIEAASYDRPWTEDDFLSALRQRNNIGMVAEHDECVVGFMVYRFEHTQIDLLNLAVHPQLCRRGIGRRMVAKLVSKLGSHPHRGRDTVAVRVRESNLAGQLFFRSLGFRAARCVDRGYYEDTGEDAYLMRYRIERPDAEATVAALEAIDRECQGR